MHREQITSDNERNSLGKGKLLTREQSIFVAMFVSGDSITMPDLVEYTQLDKSEIEETLEKIKSILKTFGLDIVKSHDGIQLMTINEASDIINRIKKKELEGDLSSAALQVMTIVSYMPGCTKSDVSYIRGAQSTSSIRNLVSRGLIIRKEEKCYISNEALSHLGINNNEDLPEYERLHKEFTDKLLESLKYE